MLGNILEFTITEPIILTAEVDACEIGDYYMNSPAFFSKLVDLLTKSFKQ